MQQHFCSIDRFMQWRCSVFQLSEELPAEDDAGEGESGSFREWQLPSRSLHRVRYRFTYEPYMQLPHPPMQPCADTQPIQTCVACICSSGRT